MGKNERINFTVGVDVDESSIKQATGSFAKIQQSLDSIRGLDANDLIRGNPTLNTTQAKQELEKLKVMANQVEAALSKSYNPKLNTYNIVQFDQELSRMGISLNDVGQSFNQLGVQGQNAFAQISAAATQTQQITRQATGVLDDMLDTLSRTAKWSIASGLINSFKGLIQETWSYTKQLDESLNNIRIVTGKSANEMERFAGKANKAAKGLAASTTAYTRASLIYYQQGLSDKDVEARTAVTIKAANVTGQSAAEVSEQLTAVWNGYKVVAEEAELYVDKLAAVAATTAADLEELSEGMSKVASAASTMGVDIDQLSAQLSTIISVTRQDANAVGTALKTIYARMGDLKVDGMDEFGTSLGDVSGQMQKMGVQVLDQQGNLRDMGTVIEEVAGKWGTWTDAQRQAAAVAIAGKRQYNNLIALFDNWDMYESSLMTSQSAEGTLEDQQKTYKEGIEAMLQEVSTAAEGVKGALFDEDSIKSVTKFLTVFLEGIGHIVKAFGGLKGLLPVILGLLMKVPKIGGFISKTFFDIGSGIKSWANSFTAIQTLNKHLKASKNSLQDVSSQMYFAEQRRKSLQIMFNKGLINQDQYNDLTRYNEAIISSIKNQESALTKRDQLQKSIKGGSKAAPGTKELDARQDELLRTKTKGITSASEDARKKELDKWNRHKERGHAINAKNEEKRVELQKEFDNREANDKRFDALSQKRTQEEGLSSEEEQEYQNLKKVRIERLGKVEGGVEEFSALRTPEELEAARRVDERAIAEKDYLNATAAKKDLIQQNLGNNLTKEEKDKLKTYQTSIDEKKELTDEEMAEYTSLSERNTGYSRKEQKQYKKYQETLDAGGVLTDEEQAQYDEMTAFAKSNMLEKDRKAYEEQEQKAQDSRKVMATTNVGIEDIERERDAGVSADDNEALKSFKADMQETVNMQTEMSQDAQMDLIPDDEAGKAKELKQLLKEIFDIKKSISDLEVTREEDLQALQDYEASGGTKGREEKKASLVAAQDELLMKGMDDATKATYQDLSAKKAAGTLTQDETTQLAGMVSTAQSSMGAEDAEAYKGMTADVQAIDTEIQAYEEATQRLIDYEKKLKDAQKTLQQTQEAFNGKRKGLKPSADAASKSIAKTKETLEKLKKTKNLTKEQQKQIEELERKLNSLKDKGDGTFESIAEDGSKVTLSMEEVGDTLTDSSEKVGQLEDSFKENGKAAVEEAEKIAEGTDEVTLATNGAKEAQKKYKEEAQKFTGMDMANTLSNIASNAMVLVGSTNALMSSIQGLVDGTTEPMDAVMGIFTGLLGMIPGIVTSVQTGMKLIKASGEATGAGLATAGTTAQAAFGWISIIMTAVALLMSLIFSLIKMFAKEEESATQKAEKALKAAQERAEKAQETLKSVKEEYSDLLGKISDYKEAKTALSELRTGTEEWKKAVSELNMQVLDLVAQYPTLLEYMSTDSGGVLSISQDGFDKVIEEKQQQIKDAAAAATFSKIAVKAAEKDLKEANLEDAGVNSKGEKSAYDSVLKSYQEDNGFLASAKEDIDFTALAQKYIDKKNDYVYDYYSDGSRLKTEDEIRNEVAAEDDTIDDNILTAITSGIVDGYGTLKWDDEHNSTKELADALEKNYEALEGNIQALDQNAQHTRALEQAYIRQIADKEGIADTETYANMAMTMEDLGSSYDDMIKEAGDEYWDTYLSDYAGSDQTNDDDALDDSVKSSIYELYGDDAKITGMDDVDWSKVESLDDFKDIEFEVNGEGMTGADLVAKYGEDYVENKLLNANKELENQINSYAEQGIDTRAAYFMQGEHFQYDQNKADKANLSISDIMGMQSTVTDESTLANLQAYRDSFETRRNDMMSQIADITSLSGTEAGFADFSLDDFKTMQNNMLKAQAAGGGDAVAELYEKYANDAEALSLINEQMSTVNWSDTGSIGTFISALSEQGIIIDENNVAWNDFMEDVYDGTKQWINNSKQVIDNLATIKSLTGDIQVGDILSDEDYKRLLAISPEIANMFIKTADGYKSLANSKDLDKVLKKQYQSLGELKGFYNDVAAELETSGIQGSLSADFNKSGDVIDYMSTFAASENVHNYEKLFDYAGTNKAAVEAAYKYVNTEGVDTTSTQYIEYLNLLKETANKINQAALDNENGILNSREGQEIWATEIASSWSEIQGTLAYKEEEVTDEEGNVTTQQVVYNKAEEMWKNTFLTEMGFSGATSFNLGAGELEEHLTNIRKLELDYFQGINAQLDILEGKIEKAFGSEKVALLNEQIALQEESLELANEQARTARNTFDSMLMGFLSGAYETYGVSGDSLLTDTGDLDIAALRDVQANYAEGSNEYADIENLINMWSSVNDAASAASEAAWKLIDASVEAFKYQTEIQDKLNETAKKWMDFGRKFEGYASGDLDVFGKESAADMINNAFEDYAASQGSYENWMSQVNAMGNIMDNYNANIASYNEAAQATATANADYVAAQQTLVEKQDAYNSLQAQLANANELKGDAEDAVKAQQDAAANAQKQKDEMDAAQAVYNTKKQEADQAATDRAKKDEELAAANKALADAEAAQLAAQNSRDAAKSKLDAASKKEKDGAKEALSNAQDGLDTANQALADAKAKQEAAVAAQKLAQDAEAAANTAKADAEAVLSKETSEYTNTQAAADNAEQVAKDAVKAYAESLGVEYTDGMTIESLSGDLAKLEEDVAKAADSVAEAQGAYQDAQTALMSAQDAQRKIAENIAANNPYATVAEDGSLIWDQSAFETDWEGYLESAQGSLEDMQAQLQNMYSGYLQAQDELMAIYDKEIEKLNTINSILTTSADLWKMIGKNASDYSSKLQDYYKQARENSGQAYQLASAELMVAQEEYEKVKKLGEQASEEMLEKVSANLTNATNKVMSTASEWLTAISTEFSETLNTTIDDFIKKSSEAGLDLAGMTEEWNLTKEKDDRYVDDVNETYAVDNLSRQYQKAIDETDSITAQNKLMQARLKMEEELTKAKEKQGKLSQYDLDRANALYDLTLKQIALEEAQQTANKMKLTRDASGNYTYQYVADQDAVAQAEEELAAAQNNVYNLDKERNQTLVDDYYATMSEANAAISEAMAEGDMDRVKRLQDYYFGEGGLLSGIQNELGLAQENLSGIGKEIMGADWTSSLSSFTNAIVDSNLSDLAKDVGDLVTNSTNTFDSVASTISELFESDSAVGKSLDLITTSLKGADEIAAETEELMVATHNVVTQLPTLTREIDTLAKNLESAGEKYQSWLEQQTGETDNITENTRALDDSTAATRDLIEAIKTKLGSPSNDNTDGEASQNT